MATLGPNDLKQYALPSYWDAATMENTRLQSGETFAQLLNDIAAGMAIVNAELLSDPLYAGLVSLTTEDALEYRIGVSNGFVAHTEYTLPDAKRGATTGHMLPLNAYDRGMGWTWDFLRKARRAQIDADIASAVQDVKDLYQKTILQRLFKSTFTAIGSSGRSMPLADGGTADTTYVPVAYTERAAAFTSSHDHIHHQDGITQANLETAIANLWEHGKDGPWELLISAADIASWTLTSSVTGFVPKADPLLRYGLTADLANVGMEYIGAIETDYGACRVRACGRIPTLWWAVYKSYGALDQRNPLRVRYNPMFGIGAILMAGSEVGKFPLQGATMFSEFGVAVGEDRVAAAVYKNHSSAWADPTIT